MTRKKPWNLVSWRSLGIKLNWRNQRERKQRKVCKRGTLFIDTCASRRFCIRRGYHILSHPGQVLLSFWQVTGLHSTDFLTLRLHCSPALSSCSWLIPWPLTAPPESLSLKVTSLDQKHFPWPLKQLSLLSSMFSFPFLFTLPSWHLPQFVIMWLFTSLFPNKTTFPGVEAKSVFSPPAHSTGPHPDSVFKYLFSEGICTVSTLQLFEKYFCLC